MEDLANKQIKNSPENGRIKLPLKDVKKRDGYINTETRSKQADVFSKLPTSDTVSSCESK